MESLKGKVIRFFLGFVSRYIPLGQAQLATMGGIGLEAKIWEESGVPLQNGWLIERSRERFSALIEHLRYHTHNQLGTFDKILAGFGEDRANIDAFHLDLCGTLSERAIADFAKAVPLILKSKGRCLAITVADQRRNLVLEQWPDFQARAKKLFGKQAEEIYQKLLSRQRRIPVNEDVPAFIKPFDPNKAAQREFGLLVELAELLSSQNLPWIPATVERYVYVSRYQQRPFRMRTYFFRFELKSRAKGAITFAQTWANSQLFFANGEEFQEIKTAIGVTPTVIKTEKKEVTYMSTSKLGELAKVLGGAEEAEYAQLLAKSQQLDAFLAALKGVGVASIENTKPVQDGSAEPEPAPRAKRTRKNWYDLTIQEQIIWLLKTLELRARSQDGNWHNGEWERLLKEDFGHYDTKLGGSLRAALARTSGGFREMFKARIEKAFGADAKPHLDRLAKIQ